MPRKVKPKRAERVYEKPPPIVRCACGCNVEVLNCCAAGRRRRRDRLRGK